MPDKIKLSPSTLNLYLDCPRCFWLQVKGKIRRPRGIFPSLPGGIDLALKKYFNLYRGKRELPSILKGKVPGSLIQDLPKRFNYFDPEIDAELAGMLDECLDLGDGTFAALDNKTRASRPESIIHAYEVQLDMYTLLLEKNGYKTKKIAYLAYYFPIEVGDNGFNFGIDVKEVQTDPERARRLFREATQVIRSTNIPQPGPKCEYCNREAKLKTYKV